MTNLKQKIDELKLMLVTANFSEDEIDKIMEAVEFAKFKHDGQFRRSGEPYVIHPICVAIILVEWDMDVDTICAGILHDVLEDTMTQEIEIETKFGKSVLKLVNYVTKVSLFSKENRSNQKEKTECLIDYTIKVFLSMSQDVRAIIIKLADRYHNMTTIEYLAPEKQRRIASETFEIYAPIAGRLGMYEIKTLLLDLSFKVLHPYNFLTIKEKMDVMIKENDSKWKSLTEKIKDILKPNVSNFQMKSRIKGIYSTFEKIERNYRIEDIHDIYAVRIIVDNVLDCYKILGLIHLNFTYLDKTLKDYISSPKLNYYQSIHTTIIKNKTLMEIQIRTKEMDDIASNGVAAHWRYKEEDTKDSINNLVTKNNFMQDFINNNIQNVEAVKEITKNAIFEVLILNNESRIIIDNHTKVIDLAVRFDTSRIAKLKFVMINGVKAELYTILKAGDTVNFVYSEVACIKSTWLKFSNNKSTCEVLKNELSRLENKRWIDTNEFVKKVKVKLGSNFVGLDKMIVLIKKYAGILSLKDFLKAIPDEMYEDDDLINVFDKRKFISKPAIESFNKKFSKVRMLTKYIKSLDGLEISNFSFPHCCNKVPFMNIVGKFIKNNILEVHDQNCNELKSGNLKQKVYPLIWNSENVEKYPRNFRFSNRFEATWIPTIGNIICRIFNDFRLAISEIKIKRNEILNTCLIDFVLYVPNVISVEKAFKKINEELNITQMPIV